MAIDSKKRKASELEDHSTTNGNAKKTKGRRSSKKEAAPEPIPDPPFKVVCPPNDDPDYKQGFEPFEPLQGFRFDYAVKSYKPDVLWENTKSYKHVKRKSAPQRSTFRRLIKYSCRNGCKRWGYRLRPAQSKGK